MLQYQQDYDDTIVPYWYYLSSSAPYVAQTWYAKYYLTAGTYDFSQGLLQPYMKSAAIQDCQDAATIPFGTPPLPVAYGINYKLVQAFVVNGLTNQMGIPASGITATAETVAFADTARYSGTAPIRLGLAMYPSQSLKANQYSSIHGRHSGFANVVWCDGHAKAMKVAFPSTTPNGIGGKPYNIGDLVNPQYPIDGCDAANEKTSAGECFEDYYFSLTKPGS